MKSKYLRDIGCEHSYDDDERKERFEEERELYGIASYETWNLDISFMEFIYVSFNMYNEVNCIDTHYPKFNIDDEEWDLQQAIDYIIEISKKYLVERKDFFPDYEELSDKFYKVLKTVMPFMWW